MGQLPWRQERVVPAAKFLTFTHHIADRLAADFIGDHWITKDGLHVLSDVLHRARFAPARFAALHGTHDSLNRLGSRAPGGPIVFSGSLNEAGTVTIDGQPADVDAANNFRGTATLSAATTTVTVKAKDASGNETTQQYEVDASGSTTSYTYDANGNLTSDGTKTYFWNALNQLVEVKEGSTTIATFEYDGDGRRTKKVVAGLTHHYIYDSEDIVEERITGSSSDTIRDYHGAAIDEPLARKNNNDVVTYYLADHLGSIAQETNAVGAVTLEREYDPWGVAMQGASTSGYAFAGREWDAETQLHYYRARCYSPEHGRFMSDDPSGLSAGSNLLEYVGYSPTGQIDPFGLQWFRPPNEQSALGRQGTIIEPDGVGQVIADNVPAAHTFSKIHDQLLPDTIENVQRYVPIPDGLADVLFNIPTMPAAALQALTRETNRSLREGTQSAKDWVKGIFQNPDSTRSCPR